MKQSPECGGYLKADERNIERETIKVKERWTGSVRILAHCLVVPFVGEDVTMKNTAESLIKAS